MRPLLRITFVGALGFAALACGDDDPSASEQVCDARTDLRSAVDTVVDETRSGNFGQAQDDLQQVRSAADQLQSATNDLASEQRQALEPDVNKLQSDVSSLTDVSSLDQLSTTVATIQTDLQSIFDEITSSLNCD